MSQRYRTIKVCCRLQLTKTIHSVSSRFPVLDLRPFSDRNRWGQRALHKESVVVELVGIDVQTSFGGEQAKRVDVECRSLTGKYNELLRSEVSYDEHPVCPLVESNK